MRTITVTGHGSASVTPDTAVVRLSVAHRAASVAEALAGVESGLRVVGEVARRHTESARIRSEDLHVWPAHDGDGRAAGFEARHSLTIGCPDLASAGSMVNDLADEVGDRLQLDGVSLRVGDPGPAEGAAREAAYADARMRAEHLAALAGATLGDVQSVAETNRGAEPVDSTRALAATQEMSLEPGRTSVAVHLSVTFELL